MQSATVAPVPATARFGLGRHLALASFWFGINFHWIPILPVLLPYQVSQLLPRASQGRGLAVLFGPGAVFAPPLPPLGGGHSDRLPPPLGKGPALQAGRPPLHQGGRPHPGPPPP